MGALLTDTWKVSPAESSRIVGARVSHFCPLQHLLTGGAGVRIFTLAEMGKRVGGDYVCDDEDQRKFQEDGYVHLSGVLSPEEIADIEKEYMKFIDRQIPVEGRDFCDMSGDYSKPLSDFSIVNIMLPRKYHPSMKDNVYEVC